MSSAERNEALARLGEAGRSLSDAAVLYHTTMADQVGLSPSHWKVLGLVERFGPLTVGELSERAGLAPPSISNIVDRLEEKGLAGRSPDPEDRRRTLVAIDPEGTAGLYALFGGLMRRLGELHARYTDEELQLLADYMSAAAEVQREATAELAEDPLPGGALPPGSERDR